MINFCRSWTTFTPLATVLDTLVGMPGHDFAVALRSTVIGYGFTTQWTIRRTTFTSFIVIVCTGTRIRHVAVIVVDKPIGRLRITSRVL